MFDSQRLLMTLKTLACSSTKSLESGPPCLPLFSEFGTAHKVSLLFGLGLAGSIQKLRRPAFRRRDPGRYA